MDDAATRKAAMVTRIRKDREFWRGLVDEVGRGRMNEPGPMGQWTFADLAGHLAAWRNRTIARLEAAVRGASDPGSPWPAQLENDDDINEWIRAHDEGRSADDLVRDYDTSFDRLATVIETMPDEMITKPIPSLGGNALVDADFTGHLHQEHLPALREWLAKR